MFLSPKSYEICCRLINNLPLHIDTMTIVFEDKSKNNQEVLNLPFTLKKIIIDDETFLKYIPKIPYDCIVEIKKNEKLIKYY